MKNINFLKMVKKKKKKKGWVECRVEKALASTNKCFLNNMNQKNKVMPFFEDKRVVHSLLSLRDMIPS